MILPPGATTALGLTVAGGTNSPITPGIGGDMPG
jgi:hypothetical protein